MIVLTRILSILCGQLLIFSLMGCETENPLCTDNYCVTGEIFEKSDLKKGQDFGTLPLDEAALLAALENPPPGDMIAKNVPSYLDLGTAQRTNKRNLKATLEQGTQLKSGLILPPNTFAVSKDFTIIVGHSGADGTVGVFVNDNLKSISQNSLVVDKELGIVLVKHGHNWVVDRYTPGKDEPVPGETLGLPIRTTLPKIFLDPDAYNGKYVKVNAVTIGGKDPENGLIAIADVNDIKFKNGKVFSYPFDRWIYISDPRNKYSANLKSDTHYTFLLQVFSGGITVSNMRGVMVGDPVKLHR